MEKKPRLLIIDDEDIVLKSCKRILIKEPYEVETAYSAEHGLEKLEKGGYDVVITDLMMPGMGGMELLRTIKQRNMDVTVIIFTGFATAETAREALKMGAFDYIPKPFTPEEFRDVVGNAVKTREENSDAKMLDLMAIVSHDLKSPISVVQTNAETLYRGYFGDLAPDQKKTIEAILRNCQYLEDIIRTYIDLSKMGLDGMGFMKQEINLVEDVVRPILEQPENQNNIKGIKINAEFRERPVVSADPNLLKIVVTNLLNNAIKYGTAGSEIKIGVEKRDGGHVFSIYNEGVGLSKEDIESRLFKKYSRVKQKGTEGIKGTGLGLYICKTIMDKHGGRIWAESEQGKWIRFFFSIP
ncbi:MAG: response regulator [Spirochaetes bacterium]|jgi:signal transduction histidine kinase|nr:response regulator [Spirochaetota bacterium]